MKKRDTYEPILIRELPMLRLVIGSVSQFLSFCLTFGSFPFLTARARKEGRRRQKKEETGGTTAALQKRKEMTLR